MLRSCKRPGMALLGAPRSINTGVQVNVGADPWYCAAATLLPGQVTGPFGVLRERINNEA